MQVRTAEDVKAARERLGMSQAELARALRMSPKNGDRTVRRWEKGASVPEWMKLEIEALVRNAGGC